MKNVTIDMSAECSTHGHLPFDEKIKNFFEAVCPKTEFVLGETGVRQLLIEKLSEVDKICADVDKITLTLRGFEAYSKQPAKTVLSSVAYLDKEEVSKLEAELSGKNRATVTVNIDLIDSDNNICITAKFTWLLQKSPD